MDVNSSNKIFFSDEVHFTLGGYVNKQNCHIWGSEYPQVIEERSLHLEKVTVGCAVWSEVVIGPLFENGDETTTYIHNWQLQPFSQDYWPSFSHHLCCVC